MKQEYLNGMSIPAHVTSTSPPPSAPPALAREQPPQVHVHAEVALDTVRTRAEVGVDVDLGEWTQPAPLEATAEREIGIGLDAGSRPGEEDLAAADTDLEMAVGEEAGHGEHAEADVMRVHHVAAAVRDAQETELRLQVGLGDVLS